MGGICCFGSCSVAVAARAGRCTRPPRIVTVGESNRHLAGNVTRTARSAWRAAFSSVFGAGRGHSHTNSEPNAKETMTNAVGLMILSTSRNFPNISKRSQREHDKNKDMTRYLGYFLMWDGYPYFPLPKEFPLERLPSEMPDVAFTKVT